MLIVKCPNHQIEHGTSHLFEYHPHENKTTEKSITYCSHECNATMRDIAFSNERQLSLIMFCQIWSDKIPLCYSPLSQLMHNKACFIHKVMQIQSVNRLVAT